MTELEKLNKEIIKRRALQHALYRWVAAIREALLNKLRRDPRAAPFGNLPEQEFEIVKRDLNQCERMLMTGGIDEDPVLEIWRRDKARAGVLWFNFAPPDSEEP